MEETRLSILPDERFKDLLPDLESRMGSIARSITPENLSSIMDETMRRTIGLAFEGAGASEGTVWILESATESLVPSYNTGPHAEKFVGKFNQPLSAGLISMVFTSEQAFLENQVFANRSHDKSLDSGLGVQTYAMIAVPLYFLGACRGVLSCVQLTDPNSSAHAPQGFDEADKATVSLAAAVFGRLIDYSALRKTVGLP